MQKSVRIALNGESNRICDILAELLVEEYTRRDAGTRCRLSVLAGEGMIMVAGHVHSMADLDIGALISTAYTELTGKSDIEPFVHVEQTQKDGFSESKWVHHDVGMAYGFATQETPEQLPYPLVLAHRVRQRLNDVRLADPLCSWIGYDGAVMVTTNRRRCEFLHIDIEHPVNMNMPDVQQMIFERVVTPLLVEEDETQVKVMGRGATPIGLSYAPGATGVASESMTYAGLIPGSSVSFAGRDVYAPARVAVYEARRIARKLLKQSGAPSVLVQLPYADERIIGDRVHVITGTGEDISELARTDQYRVEELVQEFDLIKAPLRLLAEHGQFVPELAPWELL